MSSWIWGFLIPKQNAGTRVLEKWSRRGGGFIILFLPPLPCKIFFFGNRPGFAKSKIKNSVVIYSICARNIIFSSQGWHFLLDRALDGGISLCVVRNSFV